jgi:hypothetical protein
MRKKGDFLVDVQQLHSIGLEKSYVRDILRTLTPINSESTLPGEKTRYFFSHFQRAWYKRFKVWVFSPGSISRRYFCESQMFLDEQTLTRGSISMDILHILLRRPKISKEEMYFQAIHLWIRKFIKEPHVVSLNRKFGYIGSRDYDREFLKCIKYLLEKNYIQETRKHKKKVFVLNGINFSVSQAILLNISKLRVRSSEERLHALKTISKCIHKNCSTRVRGLEVSRLALANMFTHRATLAKIILLLRERGVKII